MANRYEPELVVKRIGEIYIFRFPESTPDDFPNTHPNPKGDLFVVYHSNGNSHVCVWRDGAFWYQWGESDADWEVGVSVEYWFRIPTAKEIVDGENQIHSADTTDKS